VAAGTYNATLTVSNGNNCTSPGIAITVTVKPSPVTTASVPSQTICVASPTGPATISTINFNTPAGAATYTWTRTNPGGFLPGTGTNIPTSGGGSSIS